MEPLEMAIQMEIEGKEFYLKASEKAGDELGKELFARLAQEEDSHAAKAREISDFLKRGEKPMAIEESLDKGKKTKSIFAKAKKGLASRRKVASNEMEVIKLALNMEEKSRKFYEDNSGHAGSDFEKRFFTALEQEERGHYLSLVDYREYLIDTAGWFAKSEHISLDGG
ncbi:MAG: ferritin family protein [Dehalococcoidia bacterium]|nr:ferritin family protein [Dehalococcoidia bacterium]